jgi:hypothetical protein
MSGGKACNCCAPLWRVSQRKCNHSKFNGGHRTKSAYSEFVCLMCLARWRTKAAYVDRIIDILPGEYEEAVADHDRRTARYASKEDVWEFGPDGVPFKN